MYFILISEKDTEAAGSAAVLVTGAVFLIIFTVGVILFYIWTLIVAHNARKEIKNDQKINFPKRVVLPPKDSNNEQQIGNQVIIG